MMLVKTVRNGQSYCWYESMPLFEAEIARESERRLKDKSEKKLVEETKAKQVAARALPK